MSATAPPSSAAIAAAAAAADMPRDPLLTVNLVCRLVLGPMTLLASWVPFRLLLRNGEFAAAVMTATNAVLVLFLFVNAAIWHNDDPATWWLGYGWCDIQTYCQFAMTTIYGACVCAIMRRLAKQVGLMRVTGLSARERRNRTLIQSLIIFPVPVLQLALTYLIRVRRYNIMAINGCGKSYDPDVLYLIFFILPSPIFTAAACFYAYQTYHRFRELQKTTRVALTSNSTAASRSQRAKRKLYLMAMCILVPYAPVELLFLAFNIMVGWPWTKPYDFARIHRADDPPGGRIATFRYHEVTFAEMNMNWISVITVLVIFVFFGTGKEAINTYRQYLLAMGLGRLFPGLQEEYDPDRRATGSGTKDSSWTTRRSNKSNTLSSNNLSRKGSSGPTAMHLSFYTEDAAKGPSASPLLEPSPSRTVVSPDAARDSHRVLPLFNPGLNWTRPPRFPSRFPAMVVPGFPKAGRQRPDVSPAPAHTTDEATTDTPRELAWLGKPPRSLVRTRVWSGDDGDATLVPDGLRPTYGDRDIFVRADTVISRDMDPDAA